MSEEWRKIPGINPRYEVSNLGRIRTLAHGTMQRNSYGVYNVPRKERVMVPRVSKWGYMIISLRPDVDNPARLQTFSVHRLVAMAFIPNPDNLPHVNHKDECRTNNNVDNLEWCTAQYNMNYGRRIERCAGKSRKPVAKYDLEGNLVATYAGIKEAAKDSTVSWQMISACLTRPNIKTAGGYVYKYIEKTS